MLKQDSLWHSPYTYILTKYLGAYHLCDFE